MLYPIHIPTYKGIGAASLLELQFYQAESKYFESELSILFMIISVEVLSK